MKELEVELRKPITKKGFIKFIIVLAITFIIQTILCVTQGYMKIEEYEEYARTVENANITTVIGPLFFTGPLYAFIIAIIVKVIAKIFIKKDEQIKNILSYTPLYVILLWAPVWFAITYFCEFFNITPKV